MNTTFIVLVLAIIASVEVVKCFQFSSGLARQSARLSIEMKGKGGKVPIDQRGEFMKRKKIMDAKSQMEKNKPEGVPVFKVFVRPKNGGIWIPCGDLAGDQRATALVNAWMSGFMSDMYRSQLDQGIARSIFTQEDSFSKSIIENYQPFRKFSKEDLVFGYKVEFPGLEEKLGEQKVKLLEKGMEKGWVDNLKEGFSNMFGGNN